MIYPPDEMARRGRLGGLKLRGEAKGSAKLTEPDVIEIKFGDHEGKTYAEIGEPYGVSADTVGAIRRGRTWAHVTKPHVPISSGSKFREFMSLLEEYS